VLLMPNSKHLTHDINNLVSLIYKTKLGLSWRPAYKWSNKLLFAMDSTFNFLCICTSWKFVML